MGTFPKTDEVLAKIHALGIELPDAPIRFDAYGDTEDLSKHLLELIRQGGKRAGTSLLWAIEADDETVPVVGEIEIVLDFFNEPAFVTRLVSVDIVPFVNVSTAYAATEGEGDGSLQQWRESHWEFFARECKRIGREPAESMPVVCGVFEVLNVLSTSAVA